MAGATGVDGGAGPTYIVTVILVDDDLASAEDSDEVRCADLSSSLLLARRSSWEFFLDTDECSLVELPMVVSHAGRISNDSRL